MAFASSMEWMGERVGKKVEELQDALKNKRLELCPWEEFGIECEKAATYAQLWINPCQGWNQIQWSVDYFARKCHGTAFVANIWPQTMAGLAHDALSNYEKSKMKAPPFGSYQMETWQHAENAVAAVDRSKDVTWVNDELVQVSLKLLEDPDWEQVSGEDGISVWRKYLSPNLMIADRKVDRASKFAVVKARAIIDAPVSQVYDLFTDNSRVHEYNEYCKEVTDLAWLDPATKVTQSLTGRPWSREFVTRVHYRDMGEGVKLVVNRAEDHPAAVTNAGYTRMEMPLSANLMRPLASDPSKTEFTLITHIDPGGFAATQFGAMVTNRLSTESPRTFLAALGKAVVKLNAPPAEVAQRRRGLGKNLQRVTIGAALAAASLLKVAASSASHARFTRHSANPAGNVDGAAMFEPEALWQPDDASRPVPASMAPSPPA